MDRRALRTLAPRRPLNSRRSAPTLRVHCSSRAARKAALFARGIGPGSPRRARQRHAYCSNRHRRAAQRTRCRRCGSDCRSAKDFTVLERDLYLPAMVSTRELGAIDSCSIAREPDHARALNVQLSRSTAASGITSSERQCEQKQLGEVHHGRANTSVTWDLVKRTATT